MLSHPSRHAPTGRAKRLLFETFEQRQLLAVVANDDGPYTTNEDTPFTLPGGAAEVLVPRASTWSFLDQMTNGQSGTPTEIYPLDDMAEEDATPGVADAWRSPDFNTDSSDPAIGAWSSGNGPFGAGILEGSPATAPDIVIATPLAGNERATVGTAMNTVTTYLFRTTFTIAQSTLDAGPAYGLDLLADDGGVLYLNGTEIARIRVGTAAVTAGLVATAAGPEDYAAADPFTVFTKTAAEITALMRPAAENTLAFELHQAGTTSSDIGFDLSFSAIGPGGLRANDTLNNPERLESLTVTTPPASGTVVLQPNGGFRYTPRANFNGSDSFVYELNNGVETDTATVSIDVTSVDDRPVAVNDAYATTANRPLVVDQPSASANTREARRGPIWTK